MTNLIINYKVSGYGKETFKDIHDFKRTSFDISFKWNDKQIYIRYENIFSLVLEGDLK